MTEINRMVPKCEVPVEITITPSQPFHVLADKLELNDCCGGKAACGKCRVKVLRPSDPPVSIDDRRHLREDEIHQNIRLACRLTPGRYTVVTVSASDTSYHVASDDLIDRRFRPGRQGPGLAVDIGTTTIMAAVFDPDGYPGGGTVVADNKQARYGLDIIDRLAAVHVNGLRDELKTAVYESIRSVMNELSVLTAIDRNGWIMGVGNSAMYHLALGLDVSSLAEYPFRPLMHNVKSTINVMVHGQSYEINFAAPLGGFVGSDAIAAFCAVKRLTPYSTWILVDLGSNCEILLRCETGIFFTSAAAGPAFEGYNLHCGMRARRGAIRHVDSTDTGFRCTIEGDSDPVGICGTGYIDYISGLVEQELVDVTGLIRGKCADGTRKLFPTDKINVFITQRDIRELQKAKSAVALGIRAVMESARLFPSDIEALYIAGSFGHDLRIDHAQKIGLIPLIDPDRCYAAGNLALLGAGFAESPEADVIRNTAHRISDLSSYYRDRRYLESFRLEPWEM